jgi:hypothetical protein
VRRQFFTKYNGNKFLAVRSLLWLQDADQEPDPVSLQPWTWTAVRETMLSLADTLVWELYHKLKTLALIEHINRVGTVFLSGAIITDFYSGISRAIH